MPPRNYRKEYREKLSAFKSATASYEVSPGNAKLLAEAYMDIRHVTLAGEQTAGLVIDVDKQNKAFIDAADKFGKDFWSGVSKVPKKYVDHYIRQFREEMHVAAGSHGEYDRDQIAQRYYDAMDLAGKSLHKMKSDVLENMYYEAEHLIGKERVDRIFEMHPDYYDMVPNLSALHKEEQDKLLAEERRLAAEKEAERAKQRAEKNEKILEDYTAEINARAQRQQEAEEARYEALDDANGIIGRAFKDEDLSERLSAFLEKKEADFEKVNEIYKDESVDERAKIKKAISEDIAFLSDLKRHTERLYNYGQGDDMRPLDNTVKVIQNKFPAQLERLFATLPNEQPGSMEHKDRLEMIQACGSMLAITQRFANTAAEQGMPLKDVEVKDPLITARKTLQLFSKELDRIPKDDDDSELFTSFKNALNEAANGGSMKNLWDASSDYYNGRRGIIFGPFTEVGKHRLHLADHVYEFLKDIKWKTLENEAQKRAEEAQAKAAQQKVEEPKAEEVKDQPKAEEPKVDQPKAEEPKVGQPTDARIENGRKGTQNILNGDREALIARFQKLGLPREVIEEQLDAALESNQQNNDAPAVEQPQLNNPVNGQPQMNIPG